MIFISTFTFISFWLSLAAINAAWQIRQKLNANTWVDKKYLAAYIDKRLGETPEAGRSDGPYRSGESSESTAVNNSDSDPDVPFVQGQMVNFQFKDDGFPIWKGPEFSAKYLGFRRVGGVTMVQVSMGDSDEKEYLELSDVLMTHPRR